MIEEKKIIESLRMVISGLNQSTESISAVYMFGSRGDGSHRECSDLDLAFLLDFKAYRNDPVSAVSPAYMAAEQLSRIFNVATDVVILNSSSVEIAYEAITTGRCIFDTDSEKRIDYECAIRGMYFDIRPFLEKIRSEALADL